MVVVSMRTLSMEEDIEPIASLVSTELVSRNNSHRKSKGATMCKIEVVGTESL